MTRQFGPLVTCKFIDVTSSDLDKYPAVKKLIEERRAHYPIIAINGKVRYVGTFSHTFILRDIAVLTGTKRR
ncbi:MAG TPA: hypothetical protein GXX29_13750 [Firmicutes bacterium]|nr:hypothetical protein [Bacillota bacterium]